MKISTKGECIFCLKQFKKAGFTRHIKTCKKMKFYFDKHFTKISDKINGFYISISSKYNPEFWMHIIIDGKETLERIDYFLRTTWLECCGHLSKFTIDDVCYSSYSEGVFEEDDFQIDDNELDLDDTEMEGLSKMASENNEQLSEFAFNFLDKVGIEPSKLEGDFNENSLLRLVNEKIEQMSGEEINELDRIVKEFIKEDISELEYDENFEESIFGNSLFQNINNDEHQNMNVKISDILSENSKFSYIYDFGSSTELILKVNKVDQIDYNFDSFLLLTRNELPTYKCDTCDNIAEFLCEECLFEGNSLSCPSCSKQHNHDMEEDDEEFSNLIRLDVNSPRFGVCGYYG